MNDQCSKKALMAISIARLSRRRGTMILTYLVIMVFVIIFGYKTGEPSTTPSSSDRLQFTHKRSDKSTASTIPPIDSLISPNGTVIGDISFLLDFSIIAFPKSGTTFMKDYLNSSSETWLHDKEFCIKSQKDLQRFVEVYHKMHLKFHQSANRKTIKFGLKCPGVLYRDDIQIYRQYFPNVKLIIGLRHPVSWFESFYNYQSWRNVTMPPTAKLKGACTLHGKVCTDRARFHPALARLGLTDMKSDDEMNLLFGLRHADLSSGKRRRANQDHLMKITNPVFIYEVRQIHDSVLSKELSTNIQQYIEVKDAFPEIVSYTQNKNRSIDICDEEHNEVRRLLVEHGRDASDWIKKYFAKSPNVIISSPESFFDLLSDWEEDPCKINM